MKALSQCLVLAAALFSTVACRTTSGSREADTSAVRTSPVATTWEAFGAVQVSITGTVQCNLGMVMGQCPVVGQSSNPQVVALGRLLPIENGESLRPGDAIPRYLPPLSITAPFEGLLVRYDVPAEERMAGGWAVRYILVRNPASTGGGDQANSELQGWENAGAVYVTINGTEDCNLGIMIAKCPVVTASSDQQKIRVGRILPLENGLSLKPGDAVPSFLPGLSPTAPFHGMVLRVDVGHDPMIPDRNPVRFILVADGLDGSAGQASEDAAAGEPIPDL